LRKEMNYKRLKTDSPGKYLDLSQKFGILLNEEIRVLYRLASAKFWNTGRYDGLGR
jgi:hypothetical protein